MDSKTPIFLLNHKQIDRECQLYDKEAIGILSFLQKLNHLFL